MIDTASRRARLVARHHLACTALDAALTDSHGLQERAWSLGQHEAAIFDRNGNIGPTIWIDGRIVGGWAVDADARVVHRLLDHVGTEAEAALAARVHSLTTWLDGIPITPRFRTPLERELPG